jgi:hypothetical protein
MGALDGGLASVAHDALVEYAAGQPRDRRGRFGGSTGGGGGGGALSPETSEDLVVRAAIDQAKTLESKSEHTKDGWITGTQNPYDDTPIRVTGKEIVTTPDETIALSVWNSSTGYKAIQAAATGKTVITDPNKGVHFVTTADRAHAKLLGDLASRSRTSEDMEVVRGVKLERGKSALITAATRAGVGGEITIPKFTATTTNPMVALNFSTSVMVSITIPKGSRALNFEHTRANFPRGTWLRQNRESEVLLPPNTRFKVNKITRGDREGSVLVQLTVIPD